MSINGPHVSEIDAGLLQIRADNPSPMTLDGTNSYVLHADSAGAVLIDPGPKISEHLERILAHTAGRLRGIILTHQHRDHSELLDTVLDWAPDVPVYARLDRFSAHVPPVAAGDRIGFGPGDADVVEILLTPGHTEDSVSIRHRRRLFTGDTILGRGTTVVTHPEGNMRAYLDSLYHIQALSDAGAITTLAPAHGPQIEEPRRVVRDYLEHRLKRLSQVRAAYADGVHEVADLARLIYPHMGDELAPAVAQIVRAQLEYVWTEES